MRNLAENWLSWKEVQLLLNRRLGPLRVLKTHFMYGLDVFIALDVCFFTKSNILRNRVQRRVIVSICLALHFGHSMQLALTIAPQVDSDALALCDKTGAQRGSETCPRTSEKWSQNPGLRCFSPVTCCYATAVS